MDEIIPVYKPVKDVAPHCPQCNERLKGDNSIRFPYNCSCGIWKQQIKSLNFIIEPLKSSTNEKSNQI